LLSVYPEGIQPILAELLNGIESNNDGVGFTIALPNGELLTEKAIGDVTWTQGSYTIKEGKDKGKVQVYNQRNIDPTPMEKLAKRFCELREQFPDGPAMFHSRLATGGAEDTRGCHPFNTGGDISGTVLAHNGIMFSPGMQDWRSDTRIFAEDILPNRFRKFWKPAVRERLEKYLGNGNKIALITVNRRFMTRTRGGLSRAPFELFIFNEEMGTWTPEGAWHSNSGYKPRWTSSAGGWKSTGQYQYGMGDDWWDDEYPSTGLGTDRRNANQTDYDGTCDFCKAVGAVNQYTEICAYCDSCNGCGMTSLECECYVPSGTKVPANTPSSIPKAIEAGQVHPSYNLSPDEKRARFLCRIWDEFEKDETTDVTWEEYVFIREAEEAGMSVEDYAAKEQTENQAWAVEQASYAASRESDEGWLAELANDYIAAEPAEDQEDEDECNHANYTTCGCENGWQEKAKDDGEEPGIIRRLA
jgi:hypothetical protein